MARGRGRRRRDAASGDAAHLVSRQSVSDSTVQGNVVQIQRLEGDLVFGGDPEGELDRAVRLLAEDVGSRLERETGRRWIWRPAPLTLRVRPTERPVQAPAHVLLGEDIAGRPEIAERPDQTAALEPEQPDRAPDQEREPDPDRAQDQEREPEPERVSLESDITRISELFQGLPHRQLVVLGEPGAGKTVLAMLLVLGLLGDRGPDGPVPVFFSLSSWHPDTPLGSWMAQRLTEDHRFLGDLGDHGREIARRLIDTGRIIPVLDGLDEVAGTAFADVLRSFDLAFGPRAPFVVTCRSAEYETAVEESGSRLSRAAVVEIDPVEADGAIGYLRAAFGDDGRWRPVLEHLRADPDGPLAQALTTPLTLFLLRTVYENPKADPAALLDRSEFGDAGRIEDHLLDEFIPEAYASYHGLPYNEGQARRWLGTLARGPRELRWWNFTGPVGRLTAGLIFAWGTGWLFQLMWNIWIAIAGGWLAWLLLEAMNSYLLAKYVEINTAERETGDPRAQLRRYRTLAALFAAAAGIGAGAALGGWFGNGLGAPTATAWLYALVGGVLFGMATLASSAWGTYFVTRVWYALIGRLPLDLMSFLEDAHDRGVLRQPGSAYQFRHTRLQDRLSDGQPDLLESRPHNVVESGKPRIAAFASLLVVPLMRLGAQVVYVVVVPVFLLAPLLGSVPMYYKSGVHPVEDSVSYCNNGTDCIPIDIWRWSVAPNTAVTTRFTTGNHLVKAPFQELNGDLRVEKCAGASLEMTVTTDGTSEPLRTRSTGLIDLDYFDRRLPGSFKSLTIGFRRLDRASCTAQVNWQSPGLRTDQMFRLRERFS